MCKFRKVHYYYDPLVRVKTDSNDVTYYEVTVWKTIGKKTRPVNTFVSESYKEVLYLATNRVKELSYRQK